MKTQIKSLEGRNHYLIPAILLVGNQYLEGSSGRSYYGLDLLMLFGQWFNGVPVVVYHPQMGTYVSAQAPELYNSHRIGTVFNARVESGKLVADLWIDPERTRLVDQRVLQAIQRNERLEISTGQFNEVEVQPDGAYLVTSMRPDHVAVLPDQIGACSIALGCGFNRV